MILAEFAFVKTPYEFDKKGYSLTACPFGRKWMDEYICIDDSEKLPIMVGSVACHECSRFFTMNLEEHYVVCKK